MDKFSQKIYKNSFLIFHLGVIITTILIWIKFDQIKEYREDKGEDNTYLNLWVGLFILYTIFEIVYTMLIYFRDPTGYLTDKEARLIQRMNLARAVFFFVLNLYYSPEKIWDSKNELFKFISIISLTAGNTIFLKYSTRQATQKLLDKNS